MRKPLAVLGSACVLTLATACGNGTSPAAPSVSSSSPAQSATASDSSASLAPFFAANGNSSGAYFLPPSSTDVNGNLVLAGTPSVFVFQTLASGSALCTMEPDEARTLFRIGSKTVMDKVNGDARLTYQRFSSTFEVLEKLSGSGTLSVHLQGELLTAIADGPNGETWTILRVDPRSAGQSMSGSGKVGPEGGPATRDLKCGLKPDPKTGELRASIILK